MSKLFSNSLYTAIFSVINLFIGFFVIRTLSSQLGVEAYGQYALIILLPSLVLTFISFGLHISTIYHYGQGNFSFDEIMSWSYIIFVAYSVIGTVTSVIFMVLLKQVYYQEIPTYYLIIATSSIIFTSYIRQFDAILIAHKKMKTYNYLSFFQRIVTLICLICFYNRLTLFFAICIYVFAFFLHSILLFVYIRRLGSFKFSVKPGQLKLLLHFGFKDYITSVSSYLNNKADILLIGALLDTTNVGIYTLPMSIAEKIWVMSDSVGIVLFSEVAGAKNDTDKRHISQKSSRIIGFLSFLGCLVVGIFADFILLRLFSSKNIQSVVIFRLLLPGICLWGQGKLIVNNLSAMGYPGIVSIASISSLIISVVLNLIFIPLWQINGAALATSISYAFHWLFAIIAYKRIQPDTRFRDLVLIKFSDIRESISSLKNIYMKRKGKL